MNVQCKNCGKNFEKANAQIKRSSNHYCSRSCSASINNKNSPRKVKTKQCELCSNLILSSRKKCPECIQNLKPHDYMLKDAIYYSHHKSSAFALVRSRARLIAKNLGMNKCVKCGYNKHVEIAHIKPISEFSLDAKLSEINHESNILPLCPNCHWEYDHKL
jgi:hypothetical protein